MEAEKDGNGLRKDHCDHWVLFSVVSPCFEGVHRARLKPRVIHSGQHAGGCFAAWFLALHRTILWHSIDRSVLRDFGRLAVRLALLFLSHDHN